MSSPAGQDSSAWLGIDSDEPFDLSQTQRDPATQPIPEGDSQESEADKCWARFVPIGKGDKRGGFECYGDKDSYRVGRHKDCDIQINEKRISNFHLALIRNTTDPNDPIVMIEDLKSSNGTFVNGERIPAHKKTVLLHGDQIGLGHPTSVEDHDVRFVFTGPRTNGVDQQNEVYKKYSFRDELGKGTFANVSKAFDTITGATVAIKAIQKWKFAQQEKTLGMFQREISLLEKMDHENICKYIEVFEDNRQIFLVLEYVNGGDLLQYLLAHPDPGLDEDTAKSLTKQICAAMAYSHGLGIVHRDLKPENILLTDSTPPVVKIADFGLAKENNSETFLKSMVGTPEYIAPEVVLGNTKGKGYSPTVDSWSVGCIVYAMFTKGLPFAHDPEDPIEVKLQQRQVNAVDYEPLRADGVSEDAINFIKRLLDVQPATRMTLTGALTHPWLLQRSHIVPPMQPLKAFDTATSTLSTLNEASDTSGTPVITQQSSLHAFDLDQMALSKGDEDHDMRKETEEEKVEVKDDDQEMANDTVLNEPSPVSQPQLLSSLLPVSSRKRKEPPTDSSSSLSSPPSSSGLPDSLAAEVIHTPIRASARIRNQRASNSPSPMKGTKEATNLNKLQTDVAAESRKKGKTS